MTRSDYIASWVADMFFQGRGGEMAKLTKSQARELIAKGIADAEESWPEFERELMKMVACDRAGEAGLGRSAGS